MEEMKCDCFYEGLYPKYWWMLAHKIDGENPAGYSDLFITAHKLERRPEARGPLPPKTAVCDMFSDSGNLSPFHKLKGNTTFTTQAVTIGSVEGKADSGVQQEEEGETEPSADKEVIASCGDEEIDQPMEYIIHIAKVIELCQQKKT